MSRAGFGLALLLGACGGADASDASRCGGDSTCSAECVGADERCGAGRHCSASGACVTDVSLDLGTTGSSETGSNTQVESQVCASTHVELDAQLPTVVLLIDQSGSMGERFGGSDRWQTLRSSLMDRTSGVVKTLESQVRFGLTLFSGRNGVAPCPALTTVPPGVTNFASIDRAYPMPTSAIIDDTPTGESIAATAKLLAAVREPGPKAIVLATDGEPDTCGTPDPQTPEAKELAIRATQAAFAQGISTYYISVGDEVSEEHAREMANVGQGYPRSDATRRFYRANNQQDLSDAFARIVGGVRSCSFTLSGSVKPGAETGGSVTLDGTALRLDAPNGWRLSSRSSIEVTGAACQRLKDNEKHSLVAEFPCGAVVVPVE